MNRIKRIDFCNKVDMMCENLKTDEQYKQFTYLELNLYLFFFRFMTVSKQSIPQL